MFLRTFLSFDSLSNILTFGFDPCSAVIIIHFFLYPWMSWQREAASQLTAIAYSAFMTFLCINTCLDILFILKEEGIGKQDFFEVKILKKLTRNSSCVTMWLSSWNIHDLPWKTYHLEYLTWVSLTKDEASQFPLKEGKKSTLLYESTRESRKGGSPQPLNSNQVRLNLKQPQFWPY